MKRPFFSVIIPTWNRPQSLRACLESFVDLDYPSDRWELIVVNDGGEDSFTAVSEQLKQNLPLQLITVAHGGPAAARNAGASRAQGELIAFTDDDCRVFPDWLNQFAQGFADPRWDALGGQTVTPFEQNAGEKAWQHLTDFLYEFMQDETGNSLLLISNNAAYRRATFEALGGFDQTFPLAAAEDMELSYRLLHYRFRQRFFSEAKVWHYHHLSAWGHILQQFRYGRGGYYFSETQKQQPPSELRSLYAQEWFYPSLWQSLRRKRLPLTVRALVYLAQQAYRIGMRYETFLTQIRQTKVA
ncbi:MAG: glycosyltransferase [Chloroflexi bacterium]|nr:MAG: glycosyltransferase [Chloroflexota bacterium]